MVLKRGMPNGYSDINNPLFNKKNTKILFGDAKTTMEALLIALS
ncbi:NAD(P)(+) transhydrogenase (Re/Si-specific) subunit beta [Bathymodiolus septemdierum thioautotrophic gill symbiont]|nr:NAD(P)(+) transhydrogenase (Re/Si-specific) subunit beta [Bathymodiolus septemdierum thioautotrophic gill symbiont]